MLVKDELEDICREVAVKCAIWAGPSGAAGHTLVRTQEPLNGCRSSRSVGRPAIDPVAC